MRRVSSDKAQPDRVSLGRVSPERVSADKAPPDRGPSDRGKESIEKGKPFSRLGWRLTLSYTLVTVAALAIVEILILGISVNALNDRQALAEVATRAVGEASADLYPFLRTTSKGDSGNAYDMRGLEDWLRRMSQKGFAAEDQGGISLTFGSAKFMSSGDYLAVLDGEGVFQVAEPKEAETQVKSAVSSDPALRGLIQVAMKGTKDASRLYRLTGDGGLICVAPVFDLASGSNGRVLGFLIVKSHLPSASDLYLSLLTMFGASLLIFTIGAGVLGTVFGFATARGLVRRLDRIAQAARAWSQGIFDVSIKDDSGDELGSVVQSLNSMARETKSLLEARKRLGVLEERHRLARELHDSIKQQVFAAAMQLGSAHTLFAQHPEKAETHVTKASELLHQIQTDLGDLIQALRPFRIQEEGFAEALRKLGLDWSLRKSITVEAKVEEVSGLWPEVEQAFFRIAQEALANVARHSCAARVSLELDEDEHYAYLEVSDDGVGFDVGAVLGKGAATGSSPAGEEKERLRNGAKGGTGPVSMAWAKMSGNGQRTSGSGTGSMDKEQDMGRGISYAGMRTGFGLSSMRQRMEGIGGSLLIRSAVGRGTSVLAIWPKRALRDLSEG